ncbi:MAG: proline--tRNA ligase [Actinomycetota bacterium]
MRFGRLFGQTLRDAPADAEIPSHKLLIRGAFIRQIAAGIYAWLPLGLRVLKRVEQIIREEMNAQGAVEVLMPLLQPGELWKKTGRWDDFGPVLYRIKDRSERDFCLAPTHEEMITTLAASELPSYRDLPSIPYHIQWKFRDEPRTRGGLLRGREFLMKDAYSFDVNEEALGVSYAKMTEAYQRAFQRCSLDTRMIEAQPGEMGGSGRNHEFIQPAPAGEDTFVTCERGDYAANAEVAAARAPRAYDFGDAPAEPQKVHTPGKVTVAAVAEFLGAEPRQLAKSLLYRAGDEIVCVVVPGDRDVNEYKLSPVLGGVFPRMLGDEEFEARGIAKGFSGPVGLDGTRIVADRSLEGARNLVTGANEADHHLTGVVVGRDFTPDVWADIVVAEPGDLCERCGGKLVFERGIEVGHIFELGTKYSKALDAGFTDESGRRVHYVMGCYGFGVSRTMAAVVEAHHDERGIIWPKAVAPYEVGIVQIGDDPSISSAAQDLEAGLEAAGVGCVLDDRPGVSPGAKFADADLIGYPLQIVVGKTFLNSGKLEAKIRATGERLEIEPHVDEVRRLVDSCR